MTERNRLIRLIHVGRRELRMADETYRDIVARHAHGKTSSADCTVPELERIVTHLKQAGFKVRKPASKRPAETRPLVTEPEARKLRALWLLMHRIGAVRDPSERALAAYARRTVGVDDLRWAGPNMYKLIEGLKAWAARHLPDAIRLRIAAHKTAGRIPSRIGLGAILNHVAPTLTPETFDALHRAWEWLDEFEAQTEQEDSDDVADAR